MKRLLLSTSVIFIFMTAMLPSTGSAVEMSAGVSTWYVWQDAESSAFETTTESTLMYGPVLSAKINDNFNLTFVFLYGKFNDITQKGTDEDGEYELTYDMNRYDGDIALNYRLNSYFKLFVGGKYMGYKYQVSGYDLTLKHTSYGPGAGISAVFPLGENFFLIGNLGGLYLWGKQTDSDAEGDPDLDYHEYGMNSSLSLAYYIDPASTTINLGSRYQYIITKYEGNKDPKEKTRYYGITLSATYSFSI